MAKDMMFEYQWNSSKLSKNPYKDVDYTSEYASVYKEGNLQLQIKSKILNEEIQKAIYSADSEWAEIYAYVKGLPDNTETQFQEKKQIWNNGNLTKTPIEIYELYKEYQQSKNAFKYAMYQKEMRTPYLGPIFIGVAYIILWIVFLFTWRLYSPTSTSTIFDDIFGMIWLYYPEWGTVLAAIFIPLSIHIQAKGKMEYALAAGAPPNSPDVIKARKTAAGSAAVAGVAAGFAAKAVNDKIKKESQIKKNF